MWIYNILCLTPDGPPSKNLLNGVVLAKPAQEVTRMSRRIVVDLPRPVRRRLEKSMRKTRDATYRNRVRIVLLYAKSWGAPSIAEALGCVPATAVRVIHRFLDEGEVGLLDGRRENGQPKVDEDLLQALAELVALSPEDFGWSRPTWTRELLAKTLREETGVRVSVTTVARMLRDLGARWGMARPTVLCPWSKRRKSRRLRAIRKVIENLPRREVAFFEDEVDIHLNPKIGRDWMLRGQQKVIVTPGQNQKRYIAGALSMQGDDLVFVSGPRKNTDLFLALLKELLRRHPRARRIHLVLDNYLVHKTKRVERFLQEHKGRIVLHFLPPYSPQENKIERFWRDLHANVTRNHRCRSMDQLLLKVKRYLRKEARKRRRAATAAQSTRRRHAAA